MNLYTMDPVLLAASSIAIIVVYRVYRRCTRISLADIPGPDPASFIMGLFPHPRSLNC